MKTETETKASETKRKSKFQKHPVETIVEAIIIFVISCVFAFYELPRFGPSRVRTYQDRCFMNQRHLIGAIEQYNMDNKEMLKDFNPNNISLLVKGKYLRDDWEDFSECEFYSEGDLTADGFIYCLNHGALDGKKDGKDIDAPVTPKKNARKRMTKMLINIAIAIGPTLLYLLIRLI